MRRLGLLLAAAVIIVSNVVVLVGVARNRSGGPVETIQLTQRELPTGFHEKEDTGVSLRLNWSHYGIVYPEETSWLDQAKLESIGFDTSAALRDTKHPPLPRPAFVVFEYNGAAWEHWVQKAQQEKSLGGPGPDTQTRLVAIDAAKTPEALLQKYTDHSKSLIVRGVIHAFASQTDPVTKRPGPWRLEGSISEVLPQSIHVPPPIANSFTKTPYTVTLAFGHRFEPWVIGP
ncbi:MAG TPA: DUF4824 family protein [Bryobacteraceae bacterium]|nr:DUF4824 family protein [Bryobacteraceae bacterium]